MEMASPGTETGIPGFIVAPFNNKAFEDREDAHLPLQAQLLLLPKSNGGTQKAAQDPALYPEELGKNLSLPGPGPTQVLVSEPGPAECAA